MTGFRKERSRSASIVAISFGWAGSPIHGGCLQDFSYFGLVTEVAYSGSRHMAFFKTISVGGRFRVAFASLVGILMLSGGAGLYEPHR